MGVALYEAIVHGNDHYQSLVGQLNELSSLPSIEEGKIYHWATVANGALARITRAFYPYATAENLQAIDELKDTYLAACIDQHSFEVCSRSTDYGTAIADAIFAWSATDGGHEGYTRNFPLDYVLPQGPGLWIPTRRLDGSAPLGALLPWYGNNRPFVLTREEVDGACDPGPPMEYSEDPESGFYKMAREVYDAVNQTDDEKRAIAFYWADAARVTSTPPGHTISILTQVLEQRDVSLWEAAHIYAKVTMAVAEAFTAAWHAKYKYNLIRPITYINNLIDHDWRTIIETPPFPEYTSTHSVQAGAGFQVMAELLGDNPFTDATHFPRLPKRDFASFTEAANQAGISRLYGGIHYKNSIDNGLLQGRTIARTINRLRFQK
jgi:hypothetical protein